MQDLTGYDTDTIRDKKGHKVDSIDVCPETFNLETDLNGCRSVGVTCGDGFWRCCGWITIRSGGFVCQTGVVVMEWDTLLYQHCLWFLRTGGQT